jgi:cyclase
MTTETLNNPVKTFPTLLCALLALAPALPAAEELFTLTKIVDGVYAAIAKPAYKVNCNALVVILDDGVLVVDTHSKPSAARALIEQIKTITDKPVRFVVNTHFHWDHTQGTQAYLNAWPAGLEIISSESTRQNLERRGIPRVKYQLLDAPKDIARLQAELALSNDAAKKAGLAGNLREAEAYYADLKTMQLTLPTLTFDRSLILHRPSRTVQILWLGNAHTDGDVFVYLPQEKVIATGDALHAWVPFMGDGYPYEWIATLAAVEQLDFEHVIGGHGNVMRGKSQFALWREYLGDLMTETAQVYAGGATMEEAGKQVLAILRRKYEARFENFLLRAPPNIEKAYRVISGQTK